MHMPVHRVLADSLAQAARHYPIVTILGPRQAGKTTLARMSFPDKRYVSLEQVDVRQFAHEDPRGFLAEHAGGAILDEVQNVPELLSYLQAEVDTRPEPGRFVLTGSQHFALSERVSQSLAGRTAVLVLLPLALDEVRRFPKHPTDLFETIWVGGYPRIHDREIPPERWLADYVTTYLQRDVRQVSNVGDLHQFTSFVRLCAGRTAQELNLSALGADAGVSHNTARSWLGVLEASFVCFRLPAWHDNLRKQIVKAPKLHFFDTGLACYLLGIHEPAQLRHHPLRGALFESWVASELYKWHAHRGREPRLFHFRQTRGPEIDLLVQSAQGLSLIEVKSGATVHGSFLQPLSALESQLRDAGGPRVVAKRLVYGGDEELIRSETQLVPWRKVPEVDWLAT